MAAAIIPILAAAAPLLTPLIRTLAVHVEHLFGARTGPTKFDVVLQSVLKAADAMATGGQIPGRLDPASIAAMVQTVVQQLQSAGILTPEASSALVSATPLIGSHPMKVTGQLTLS
jgi:hypothetical protein